MRMSRRHYTALMLSVLCVVSSSLIATLGCGNKGEDAPPNSAGYYTGDMKGKSMKPMNDSAGTNPAASPAANGNK